MKEKEKICIVIDAVLVERRKRGVSDEALSLRPFDEGSCEMVGEGFNLVERQLMYTREGYGYWRDLHGELLDLAFDYVTQKFAHQ